MASIGSHIARTNLVYYAMVCILSLRGIVLIPLLLHVFGPENYGRYALALSGMSYALVLIQFGMDSSVYQYLTPVLGTKAARTVFWTVVQTAMGLGAVLISVAFLIGKLMLSGVVAHLVMASSVIAASQAMWSLSLTPFRCEERSGVYMGTSLGVTLGDFAITATAATLSHDLATVFVALACYHSGVACALTAIQARRLPFHGWSRSEANRILRFGWDGLINQLVITGYFVWDRTIVSVSAGLATVAAYVPGMALAAIILPLAGTSVFTLPTLLVRPRIHRSPTLKRSILRQAIRQYLLAAIPASVGVMLIAKPFLEVITTPRLAAVGAPVAWLACGGVLASGLARFAILALRADGEDKWMSWNLAIHFAAFVLLAGGASYLWQQDAPYFVAGSIMITNVSQAAVAFHRLRRHVTNVLAPSLFLTPVIGTAAFAWLHFLVHVRGIAEILAVVGTSAAIYLAVIMFMERIGPRAFLRLLRKPVDLGEVSGLEEDLPERPRKTIILHSGPNHLFASAGIFYAAELAQNYDVHVVLPEYGRNAITQPMLDALARRSIIVHWLPDVRGIRKHEVNREFAELLIEDIQPVAVFSESDMGIFDAVLARCARAAKARVICFQTGAYGVSIESDYELLMRGYGALWARSRGLPPDWGRRFISARQHLLHIWHYYIGPILAGYRPFPGISSIFLRRSHTGQRDGEAYLVYEPGAASIAAKDGTPEAMIITISHPLLRRAGKHLFSEIYPVPDFVERNSALLLVDLPAEVSAGAAGAKTDAPAWATSLKDAISALATNLSGHYSQVLIKPHPVLERQAGFLDEIKAVLAGIPGIYFIEPSVNAIGFLSAVRIVVGEESTVLKLARYVPGLVIVSTTYSAAANKRPFHASEAGINVFDSWRQVVAADLSVLPASTPDCGCPEDADPEISLMETLQRRGFLPAADGWGGNGVVSMVVTSTA